MKMAMDAEESGRGAAGACLVSIGSRVVALIALVILGPLMLIVATAIVVDSGFPVLFQQERIGVQGRRFWMFKFRKFHASVGRNTRPLTLVNDSRCTRIGRLLARTKLDELPQLWNVVRGDMAIVGPRPEVPDFADCFAGPWRALLDYRPGIFGPSQVLFHAEASCYPQDQPLRRFYCEVLFPAKAALDLAYYPTWSMVQDLCWVFRGILAVCGAETPLVRRYRWIVPLSGSEVHRAGAQVKERVIEEL